MRKFLLLLIIVNLSVGAAIAQVRISGKLTDSEDGQPIPFATVTVKGTTIGVATDANGAYTISAPLSGSQILVFSNVGYDTREVAYNNNTKSPLNIKLSKSSLVIDDVVVTGFADVKKQTFTGSSVKVKAEDMELAGVTDASRMLEGKIAGVSIQNVSSTFGAAPKIRVRGVTSITGENKPLWVVDGVVLEDIVSVTNDQLSSGDPTTMLGSSVAGINPNDIETFDILKDAAATALYGARAMNGVVVITTKRGKQGAPRITYTGNFTMRSKPRYENYDIMNSADQMGVYVELARKGWLNPSIVNNSSSGVYGMMYNAINYYDPKTKQFGLENTVAARRAFLNKYAMANTDWFDVLFRNSIMQEHSLSISTGTDKSKTYASIGYLGDAGWTVADKVNRYTFNFRNDYEVSSKISLGFQAVASLRNQKAPGSYTRELETVSGSWSRDFDINPFSYALNTSRTLRPYDDNGNLEYITMNYAPFNILHELDNNTIDLNVYDVKLQGEFNYNIMKGLRLEMMGAIRYVGTDQDHKVTENSNVSMAWRSANNSTIRSRNPYLWSDPDDVGAEPITVMPLGGFYNTNTSSMMNYDLRAQLKYTKVWGEKYTHEFNVMGGTQVKYVDRHRDWNTRAGYQFTFGGQVNLDPNYFRKASENQTELYSSQDYYDRFAAFYATGNYAFDRRYSATFTVRYDGSNKLGTDRDARWLPTWDFGLKWNIFEEDFIKRIDKISDLAVRVSYGLNANMPNATNSSPIFRTAQTYRPGYIENMIYIANLANSELTWEKNYHLNMGMDFGMFENRLTLSVDYFTKDGFDLIAPIKVSGIGGEMTKWANYADLESKGLDVMLGGTMIKTKDWTWTGNFIFSWSENTIRNMVNEPSVNDLLNSSGASKNNYPVNSLFSIPFVGLDSQTGIPTFINESGEVSYSVYAQGQNTDFLIHEGTVDPVYTGGLNTSLRWKGLSANIFFSYGFGNKIRLTPAYSSSYSDLSATSNEFKNRWIMSGDERFTNIPAITDRIFASTVIGTGVYPYVNYNNSDIRVAKGDFIRLKTVSLNYDMPLDLVAKTKVFRSASLRLTGRDLWLLYSDKKLNGQDPEFFNTGGVAMPAQTQVILSLTLGF